MSSADRENPVLSGGIDYGRVFVTFTGYTDQKIAHGLICEEQLRGLEEQGVVLRDGQPTTLVDLGCGEGHTACAMIDAINRVHPRGDGVNYYGLDADERFVGSTEKLLNEVKGVKQLRVINVQQADVLGQKPWPLPRLDYVLATMGHVLYYAYSDHGKEQTKRNIAGVVDRVARLLGEDGICLFVHSAEDCPLATLRASVADSVEAKPAGFIATIAKENRLEVISFVAPYTLYFPCLSPQQWEDCKEPSTYGLVRNRSAPRFVAALELLTFLAQRELNGLAREGRLRRFVEDVKAQVNVDGALKGLSHYQLMLSRRHSPELKKGVEAAVHKVESSLDQFAQAAAAAFRRTAVN